MLKRIDALCEEHKIAMLCVFETDPDEETQQFHRHGACQFNGPVSEDLIAISYALAPEAAIDDLETAGRLS